MKEQTSKAKEAYLQEKFEKIEAELEYLDIKPYSKNIIEACLRATAQKYGVAAANKLIDDLGLKHYGWRKEKVKPK